MATRILFFHITTPPLKRVKNPREYDNQDIIFSYNNPTPQTRKKPIYRPDYVHLSLDRCMQRLRRILSVKQIFILLLYDTVKWRPFIGVGGGVIHNINTIRIWYTWGSPLVGSDAANDLYFPDEWSDPVKFLLSFLNSQ